jgi:hypothetical protein
VPEYRVNFCIWRNIKSGLLLVPAELGASPTKIELPNCFVKFVIAILQWNRRKVRDLQDVFGVLLGDPVVNVAWAVNGEGWKWPSALLPVTNNIEIVGKCV